MLEQQVLLELQEYVAHRLERPLLQEAEQLHFRVAPSMAPAPQREIEDYVNKVRKPTFQAVLFELIDQKGAPDAEIYKKAGLDRRHFSKIRANPGYRPGKPSVIALALALELHKKEADRLLHAAGYSLSESETFDLVIQFCLERRIFDLDEVNQALDYFSLRPLGALE